MSSRIGIMGGMFDPVHEGHFQAATAAQAACRLSRVIFVPCGRPVHKEFAHSSGFHRCEMLRLAIEGKANFVLDSRECNSEAPSYTFHTLCELKQENPEDELYFILGMDAFLNFDSWFKWREIFDLANLLVITRPGFTWSEDQVSPELLQEFSARNIALDQQLDTYKAGKIFLLEGDTPALSSSQIREDLLSNKKLDALLPVAVKHYIDQHQLYRTGVIN